MSDLAKLAETGLISTLRAFRRARLFLYCFDFLELFFIFIVSLWTRSYCFFVFVCICIVVVGMSFGLDSDYIDWLDWLFDLVLIVWIGSAIPRQS